MEVGISRMSDANCGPGSESQDSSEGGEEKGGMQWWQLSLVGVGCMIGTGDFLGSTIGIKTAGPSIRRMNRKVERGGSEDYFKKDY
jgi:amino acid permease